MKHGNVFSAYARIMLCLMYSGQRSVADRVVTSNTNTSMPMTYADFFGCSMYQMATPTTGITYVEDSAESLNITIEIRIKAR